MKKVINFFIKNIIFLIKTLLRLSYLDSNGFIRDYLDLDVSYASSLSEYFCFLSEIEKFDIVVRSFTDNYLVYLILYENREIFGLTRAFNVQERLINIENITIDMNEGELSSSSSGLSSEMSSIISDISMSGCSSENSSVRSSFSLDSCRDEFNFEDKNVDSFDFDSALEFNYDEYRNSYIDTNLNNLIDSYGVFNNVDLPIDEFFLTLSVLSLLGGVGLTAYSGVNCMHIDLNLFMKSTFSCSNSLKFVENSDFSYPACNFLIDNSSCISSVFTGGGIPGFG